MIVEKKHNPMVSYTNPKEINSKNVIYWSEHYKRLEGVEHGKAIQTKARKWVKEELIQYDPDGKKYNYLGEYDGHTFICKPLKNYNKTTYRIWQLPDKSFECSCQFFQKVSKKKGIDCSHVTALWMQLKIWNYNRKKEGVGK